MYSIRHAKDKAVYFLCCDQKPLTASAQSFTLCPQAIIEITWRDHSIIACSRHIYLCVAICAHLICGESHFQSKINWEVATTSTPFCSEPHLSHILFVNVASGTTFTSWSKHHFVVIGKPRRQVCKASHCGSKQQKRSHVVLIQFLLVCDTYIWVLFFTYIPSRSWQIAHSTQH